GLCLPCWSTDGWLASVWTGAVRRSPSFDRLRTNGGGCYGECGCGRWRTGMGVPRPSTGSGRTGVGVMANGVGAMASGDGRSPSFDRLRTNGGGSLELLSPLQAPTPCGGAQPVLAAPHECESRTEDLGQRWLAAV